MQFLGLGSGTNVNLAPNQRVKTEGAGERIGNAFCGVFFGFAMFFASLGLIWWGEGRAVFRAKSLNAALGNFNDVKCDSVDKSFDGKLIHFSCGISGYESFDDVGCVSPITALGYTATTEMYQIVENESCRTERGATMNREICSYTYSYIWSSSRVNSEAFKGNMTYCKVWNNNQICRNPSEDTGTGPEKIGISEKATTKMYIGAFGPYNQLPYSEIGSSKAVTAAQLQSESGWVQDNDKMIKKQSPLNIGFKVGDVRRSYSVRNATEASVLAGQKDGKTSPWDSGVEGYPIEEVREGRFTAKEMVAAGLSENDTMTWILRLLFFCMCWMGLQLITGPVAVAPTLIPCIGHFIGDLIGCMLCYVNFFVAGTFCLIIGAIAWIRFRPQIGIPLLICGVAAGAVVGYFRFKKKKNKV